uniref:Uncharacterized protein n=1 Tax=Timema monikensis TaxID=170555 RepID=A0A7R9E5I9_9NEOP|nr:unnamed protein product [Timema monikensis]
MIAGRGGSDGTKAPKLVDSLQEVDVVKVFCGAQFSLALTRAGHVYSWGKGDTHRLGHATEEHVRFPKLVEALQGETTLICPQLHPSSHLQLTSSLPALVSAWSKARKHVVSLAVGSVHVLALTEEGEVYGWGRNDYAQVMEPPTSSVARPTLLPALKGKVIIGIACGPTQCNGYIMRVNEKVRPCPCPCPQSFAWSSSKNWTISLRVPFVVDVCEETLRMLDQLLGQCEAVIGGDWPPPQDKECMAVACLNLLRLQGSVVESASTSAEEEMGEPQCGKQLSSRDSDPDLQLHAMISHGVDVKSLGLGPSSSLLASLKHHVVQLASAPGVLSTVQCAAQAALQAGWSVLLPTADERASTLSQLLPNTAASAGHRFMTDLLVSSLMAAGGLEAALRTACRGNPPDSCARKIRDYYRENRYGSATQVVYLIIDNPRTSCFVRAIHTKGLTSLPGKVFKVLGFRSRGTGFNYQNLYAKHRVCNEVNHSLLGTNEEIPEQRSRSTGLEN